MRLESHNPIGVFDSGIGGLTVLRALMARLPTESTVYLGDTARVPYGTKSAEVVTRYSLANAHFLLEQRIKLLVVACNTASAFALPALQSSLGIPVLGVIEPGAKAAAKVTRGRVGVIGTEGTIRSGAYAHALLSHRADLHVLSRACPLFVPLVEEGWTQGEIPSLVAKEYLTELAQASVDTLVLGCTHYPLLREVVGTVLPNVTLVDSAEATASATAELLVARGLEATTGARPEHRFFVTDVPDRFARVGSRFLGMPLTEPKQVDISSFAR